MTLNCKMALILPYVTEYGNAPYFTKFVHNVVAKQLLGLPRFQSLLLTVDDHVNIICANIQRLFRQTNFDNWV